MERKIQIEITPELDGCTIQQVLMRHGFTRHQIRSLKFREDGICLNGLRQRITHKVIDKDLLELLVEKGFAENLIAECEMTSGCQDGMASDYTSLDVLYEDQDLLIVNKQAGMPSHPGRGHYKDTVLNLVTAKSRMDGEGYLPRVIGRLDKETSGVLIFAKNQMASARLAQQREDGRLCKTYVAMVCGVPLPLSGCVELPIGAAEGSLNRMEVRQEGKRAVTYYQVIGQRAENSLVSFRLKTGRTHQIRVHMAALGHPLLYDPIYGQAVKGRMTALHAYRVELYQPFTGERIEVAAPAVRIEFKELGYEL